LVRWVEFASRFTDLPELNLPTPRELGGYLVYHSLDVLGVVAAVLLVGLGLVYVLVRMVVLSVKKVWNKNGKIVTTKNGVVVNGKVKHA
jgi:hypothetical protein